MPSLLPIPPSGVPLFNPATNSVDIQWQNYFQALASITGGFAPLDARYWVSTPNSDLTNETNMGALATGYLKQVTAVGVATPSTVASIPGTDVTGAALTRVNDTNVTATLGGTPATALLRAVSITLGWLGTLGLARGGTNADLSATGGTSQVLKQTTVGGAVSVGTVAASEIASGAALSRVSDTNVTLTLGGAPTTALLAATSITAGWSGTLGLARGGTAADLSATGGTNQIVKQNSVGAAFTVGTLASTNLSDVSTGTYTPALSFGGASVGITYTTQTGYYSLIGKHCTFTSILVLSSKGSSTGAALITLPFAPLNTANILWSFSAYGDGYAVGVLSLQAIAGVPNVASFNLVNFTAGSRTALVETDFTNTSVAVVSGSYVTV